MTSSSYPRVLVGCPTSSHKSYCLDAYLAAARHLSYPAYDLLLVDNSEDDSYFQLLLSKGVSVLKDPYFPTARERIVHSRNVLRKHALDHGYDYFLSLEQDVLPPLDVLEQLLSVQRPVVTGVYCKEYSITKKGKELRKLIMPLLYQKVDDAYVQQLTWKEVAASSVFPVAVSGLGCILIHLDVLEKISFRFQEDKEVFDDVWFSEDLQRLGIPLFVNTAVKCKHLTSGMDWNVLKK